MPCLVIDCGLDSYCSGLCSVHYNRLRTKGTLLPSNRSRASLDVRFWRWVDKRESDECWLWTGCILSTGYGNITAGGQYGKKLLAHRVSWELHNGPIPKIEGQHHGMVVMHECDNRACVNPNHLRLGIQKDNVADMDAKGRRVQVNLKGEKHPNSKFTNEQVLAIRESPMNNAELGRMYNVPRQTIRYVRVNGWKSVIS